MSYVDKNLLPGEAVTYRTRLHWKTILGSVLLAFLVCVPLAVLALASQTKLLAVIPALAAVVLLLVARVRRQSSEFAVTNRRIIIKLGVLSTRSIELLLPKVEAITVTQSMWGRVFGYGDIVVSGSGGTKEPFAGIQAPLKFRQAVQAATAHETGGGVSSSSG